MINMLWCVIGCVYQRKRETAWSKFILELLGSVIMNVMQFANAVSGLRVIKVSLTAKSVWLCCSFGAVSFIFLTVDEYSS